MDTALPYSMAIQTLVSQTREILSPYSTAGLAWLDHSWVAKLRNPHPAPFPGWTPKGQQGPVDPGQRICSPLFPGCSL